MRATIAADYGHRMTKTEFVERCERLFGAHGWKACMARACGVDYSSIKRWLGVRCIEIPWYAIQVLRFAENVPREKWPRDLIIVKRMDKHNDTDLRHFEDWGNAEGVPRYLVTILMLIERIREDERPWAGKPVRGLGIGDLVNGGANGGRVISAAPS